MSSLPKRRTLESRLSSQRELGQPGFRANPLRWGFFIGPDKAASSWFHQLCLWHPNVAVASAKELFFFDRYYSRGESWYLRQFAIEEHSEAAVEICHDYLFSEAVPGRIARFSPTAHLITCLRHPVDRAISSYHYMVRQGRVKTSFSTALREVSELIEHGRYGSHLARFLDVFPKEQLTLINFDEVRTAPADAAKTFFSALGITSELGVPSNLLQPKRAASRARSQLLATSGKKLADLLRGMKLQRVVGLAKQSSLLEQILFRKLDQEEKAAVTADDMRFMRDSLFSDSCTLDRMFGTSYTELWWKTQ